MSHDILPAAESPPTSPFVETPASSRSLLADWGIILGTGFVAGLLMCVTDGHKVSGHKSLFAMAAMILAAHWTRRPGSMAAPAWTAIVTFRLILGGGGSIVTFGVAGALAEVLRRPLLGVRSLWLRSVLGGFVCLAGYAVKIVVWPKPDPSQILGLGGHFLWGSLGVVVASFVISRTRKAGHETNE